MAVYKDGDKWRVIYRYTNYKGERKQTQKRGYNGVGVKNIVIIVMHYEKGWIDGIEKHTDFRGVILCTCEISSVGNG